MTWYRELKDTIKWQVKFFVGERLAASNQEQAVYRAEEVFKQGLTQFFKEQQRRFDDHISRRGLTQDSVASFDWRSEDKLLIDIYKEMLEKPVKLGQDFAFENMVDVVKKVRKGKSRGRKEGIYNIWTDFETRVPQAEELVQNRVLDLSERWGQVPNFTTQAEMMNQLAIGYQHFESIGDLKDRITDIWEDCQTWRAEMISRTETMRAFNNAGLDYYKATGVVDKVELIIAADACPRCQEERATQAEYTLEEAQGLLPFHPNCRCTYGPIVADETATVPEAAPEYYIPQGTELDMRYSFHMETVEEAKNAYNALHGTTLNITQYVEKLNTAIKEQVESGRFAINVEAKNLSKVLKDGRFKSQFETRSSGGMLNNRTRANVERNMFGYDMELAPSERPIYGFIADGTSNQVGMTSQYGDITCILKSSKVENSTTFVWDDSLGTMTCWATPYKAPSHYAVEGKTAMNAIIDGKSTLAKIYRGGGGAFSPYVEAQYHGGLTTDCIQDIIVRLSPSGGEISFAKIALHPENYPGLPQSMIDDATENCLKLLKEKLKLIDEVEKLKINVIIADETNFLVTAEDYKSWASETIERINRIKEGLD